MRIFVSLIRSKVMGDVLKKMNVFIIQNTLNNQKGKKRVWINKTRIICWKATELTWLCKPTVLVFTAQVISLFCLKR